MKRIKGKLTLQVSQGKAGKTKPDYRRVTANFIKARADNLPYP